MTIDWGAPEVVCNVIWAVWYSIWLAAVVFSKKTTAQGRDPGGWARSIAGFGAILLFAPAGTGAEFLGRAGLEGFTQRLWPATDTAAWTLVGLTVAGFAFCWWARLHLGRLWSGLVTLKEDHKIIDTGPYGLVRHPIYSGLMFSALMTAGLRATPAAFLGALMLIVGFGFVARIEERFLREQMGADVYGAYARRVRMLVPFIG
jgi:protein-S-isoprenylcysteine O-methyltransferase Ste14